MFSRYTARALPMLALAGACARNSGTDAGTTPIPADVPAELRVVAGESTYVTRGSGYELIARSRRDPGFVAPAVDHEIANFRRVSERYDHADRNRASSTYSRSAVRDGAVDADHLSGRCRSRAARRQSARG